jgi:hypothetical protein
MCKLAAIILAGPLSCTTAHPASHSDMIALKRVAALYDIFYTVRLLVVTGFLQHTRAGGQGAYIGAVVFPLLALGFAWIARWLWRRGIGP